MKNIVILILCTLLLVSCGAQKMLIKAPKHDLDPLPVPVQVSRGDDPLEKDQWSLKAIGAYEAWDAFQASKAVTVMIAGTGIDYNHEDLRDNVLVNYKELNSLDENTRSPFNNQDDDNDGLVDNIVGQDFVNDDGLAYDNYGHDTYLAGVIAAVHGNGKGIKGILKKVSLYPVKYIDQNGRSTFPFLLRTIKLINTVRPHVALLNLVNLKVTDLEKELLRTELELLKTKGVPLVIGAGNSDELLRADGQKVRSLFYEFENVFVVTSINAQKQKAWPANYSAQFVHTTAPGHDILTTAPGNKYKSVQGANLAAAHVAAALALASSEFSGQKSYKDYFDCLLSAPGSEELPQLNNLVLGRNTLNLMKFLSALN